MVECKVWLDNYHKGYYFPGSLIQGRVALNSNSEIKFRSIKLTLSGHEHTEWMSTERYRDARSKKHRTRQVCKTGHYKFLTNETILCGTGSSSTTLPPGQHIYPFSLSLPNDIPGSYNCEYGSISYKIEAVVDRKMAFDNKDELIFVVVTMVNLNNLCAPNLREPTDYSKSKTLYCCCCSLGPIEMDVHLPKKTLVPEETVNVSVRLSNLSNRNTEGLELKLKQRITCRVDDPRENSKLISSTLVHLKENGLGSHGQHTYTFPVKLQSGGQIPNFSSCKLFKVTYYYSVVTKLPGARPNLKIKMYPELGHVDIGQQPVTGAYPYPVPSDMPMPMPSYNFNQNNPQTSNFSTPGNSQTPQTPFQKKSPAPQPPPAPTHEDLPPSYDSIHPPEKY